MYKFLESCLCASKLFANIKPFANLLWHHYNKTYPPGPPGLSRLRCSNRVPVTITTMHYNIYHKVQHRFWSGLQRVTARPGAEFLGQELLVDHWGSKALSTTQIVFLRATMQTEPLVSWSRSWPMRQGFTINSNVNTGIYNQTRSKNLLDLLRW